MTSRVIVPSLALGETRTVTFDLTSELTIGETISSASVSALVWSGTDSTPSALISGSASPATPFVNQKVSGGVAGTVYSLVCSALTSLGNVVVQTAFLAVVASQP